MTYSRKPESEPEWIRVLWPVTALPLSGNVARGITAMNSIQDIVSGRPMPMERCWSSHATIFEQGLGLFGTPEDAALLDEVVELAYEERRRTARSSTTP
jgi:hypothetical protein